MKYFLLLVLCLTFFSCKSKWLAVAPPAEFREKIVERLVPYPVTSDSAYLYALLECDSMSNITLKELSELKSKRMQTELWLNGNALTYMAKTIIDTVFIPVTDTVRLEKIPYPVEVPVKVNELTKLQSFQIKVAWIAEILMLCYVALRMMKIDIFNIIKNLIKK